MADKEEMAPDRISELFSAKVLFITGGSGFMGKVLIEKILRCCPKVKTIYLLLRSKKNKTAADRVKEIFSDPLFDQLKRLHPNATEKCRVIAGDVTQIHLGISDSDRKLLTKEVEFIYHSAASTRFDETVKDAVVLNTRGTKYMLELAQLCDKLKIFVHVSTAYVYPKDEVLEEKLYDSPADPHEIINKVCSVTGYDPEKDKELLGGYPNTYVYSKALAEALVAEYFEKLPIILVRPSFVMPIWREPIPGWCETMHGPMGLLPGIGKGVIRSLYGNEEAKQDLIPADIAINAMLLTTWNYFNNKSYRIYNITASNEQVYYWGISLAVAVEVLRTKMPFNMILWYPNVTMRKSKISHTIFVFLFQILPALLIDNILKIFNQKPFLYRIQQRVKKTGAVLEFYTSKTWKFSNDGLTVFIKKALNNVEKDRYKIDSNGFDIETYFVNYIHAMRVHHLKETDDMLPAARRNIKLMKVLDVAVKVMVVLAVIHYISRLFFN